MTADTDPTDGDGPEDDAPDDERPAFVPDDANEAEAAAIVAAVSAHLADEEDANEDVETWDGKRWAFAARTEAVVGRSLRATDGTPTDAWAAAGRADRL